MDKDSLHRLGCCHAMCQPCWDHWKALKGAQAFCPVCRQQDFIVSVVEEAQADAAAPAPAPAEA